MFKLQGPTIVDGNCRIKQRNDSFVVFDNMVMKYLSNRAIKRIIPNICILFQIDILVFLVGYLIASGQK